MIGHVWVLGGEISRLPMTERSRRWHDRKTSTHGIKNYYKFETIVGRSEYLILIPLYNCTYNSAASPARPQACNRVVNGLWLQLHRGVIPTTLKLKGDADLLQPRDKSGSRKRFRGVCGSMEIHALSFVSILNYVWAGWLHRLRQACLGLVKQHLQTHTACDVSITQTAKRKLPLHNISRLVSRMDPQTVDTGYR